MNKKREVGDFGEDLAAKFLKKRGYKILERNFNTRIGEIDIVAEKKDKRQKILCFVEVKTRKYDDGSAERATDFRKMARIKKTAQFYCIKKAVDFDKFLFSFEQVSVYLGKNGESVLKHFEIPLD